jgi:hypothetical protein
MKKPSYGNNSQNLGDGEVSLPHVQRPFPVPISEDAFYGPIGKLVALIAPKVEPCRESILTQFLAAFANMIGDVPYIDLGEGGIQRLILFVLVVGNVGKKPKGNRLENSQEYSQKDRSQMGDRKHPNRPSERRSIGRMHL